MHGRVRGKHARDRRVGVVSARDDLLAGRALLRDRRDSLDLRRDRLGVGDRERERGPASTAHRSPSGTEPREDLHEVGARRRDGVRDRGLSALTDRHHDDHRRDADHDT